MTQQSMVAMAWFENPALYRNSRSIMSDKSSLPLAYMDWVDLAKRNEKILEATGAQGRPRPDLAGRLSRFLPTSRLRSRQRRPVAIRRLNARPPRKVRKPFFAMESQYDIIPQQPQFDPHFNFCPFCQEPYAHLTCPKCGHSTDNDSSRERPWQAVVGPSRP